MRIILIILFLSLLSCNGGNPPQIDAEPDNDSQSVDIDDSGDDDSVGDEDAVDEVDIVEDDAEVIDEMEDADEDEVQDIGDLDDDTDDEDNEPETVIVPECMNYSSPNSTAVLDNDGLKEISGIAVSYRNPGLIWVHNDSGGEAALFAIGFDGTVVAKLILDGITNVDWEALSLNPCGMNDCFYIGDIGDNSLVRDDYSIIKVEEPIVTASGSPEEIISTDWTAYPIEYEDGSKNSEGMAVDKDGTIYIFTKQIGSTDVYKLDTLLEEDNIFTKIGSIDTGIEVPGYPAEAQPSLVTGADINRNGTRLLLRTYGIFTTDNDGIREFMFNEGSFEEIFTFSPIMVPEGKDMQGEAVGYNPFTGGYVHISEFYHKVVDFDQNIWVIDCND